MTNWKAGHLHSELVPKKNRQSKRVDKLKTAFSRAVNPVLLKFRYGYVYYEGRWQFRKVRIKPKKFRHTFEDGTPHWDLDEAAPLPLDENAQRRLVEIPVDGESGKKKRKKSRNRQRRYIPATLGVEGFFEALNKLGVRYAVLRWFDDLPHIEEGEDIDLLFEDEAMEKIDHLFIPGQKRGGIKCDVYSSGGLPGSNFEGLPYYEQRLAEEILDNTVMVKGVFRAPDTRRHLLSLAYHAAYHKAHNSGLPLNLGEPPLKPVKDHDYGGELERLAAECDMGIVPSLYGVHHFLRENEWMPGIDMLRKLSLHRPVLRLFLEMDGNAVKPVGIEPQLCVFVVREWAEKRYLVPWIAANLRHYGFDVKWVHELNDEERERARTRIRGGNWNRGPWPVSGGPPTTMIVACDYAPEPPDPELRRKQPFARNARFVNIKALIRDGVNKYLPDHLKTNPVHSADDDLEAWDYIESVCPQKVGTIREMVAEGYRGDPYTRLKLSSGKRATTYLVYRDGKPYVLKVFSDHKDGCAALKAEKRAYENFRDMPWSGGWVEFGPNWMLQAYHDPSRRLDLLAEKLTVEQKTEIAGKALAIAREIHSAGFAHRDLHVQNFFWDDRQLRVIDFETLTQQDPSFPFEKSYDVTGEGLESPLASGHMCYTNRKNSRSLSRTLGVSLSDALKAEAALKQKKSK